MDEINKVLIYRTDRYGDFLISAPFMKSLKFKYPNIKMHVICSYYNAEFIKTFSFVDEVFIYRDGFINRFLMIFEFFFKKYSLIFILDGKRRSLFHSIFLRGKSYYLIKNPFLIRFCNFFNMSFVINSESDTQLNSFNHLANLLDFNINKFNIYEKYKFHHNNIVLPKKFVLLHLDEKWFKKFYYHDYTDINPTLNDIVKILKFILNNNKVLKIVVTTGVKENKIIKNLNTYLKKNKKFSTSIYILSRTNFFEMQYIVSKCNSLICCEGGISHVSNYFKKPTIALYEKNRLDFYLYWTGHMKNIILHPRENIKFIVKNNSFFFDKLKLLLRN